MADPSEISHDGLSEAVDRAFTGDRDQRDFARLARLEPHRRSWRDVEPHAACLAALELQRRIGFEEMIVRADLDRPVAGVGNRERDCAAAFVELDLAVLDEIFAGYHVGLT